MREVIAKDQTEIDVGLKAYMVKRAAYDKLEAELETLKDKLKSAYKADLENGDFEIHTSDGKVKAIFEKTSTKRFSEAKFKEANPALHAMFIATSSGTKLSIREVTPSE